MVLCVSSLSISLIMIVRMRALYFVIIIKSQVYPICHCLGLGQETMVSAVCLSIFLCTEFVVWRSNYIHIELWDAIIHPYPNSKLQRRFSLTMVKIIVCMSYYIPYQIMDIITNLCPNISQSMLVSHLTKVISSRTGQPRHTNHALLWFFGVTKMVLHGPLARSLSTQNLCRRQLIIHEVCVLDLNRTNSSMATKGRNQQRQFWLSPSQIVSLSFVWANGNRRSLSMLSVTLVPRVVVLSFFF